MKRTDKFEVSICSKCKTEKPVSEFHRDSRKKKGIVSKCKQCSAEDQRSRNKRRAETLRNKRKTRSAEEIAAQKKYKSDYYQKNKEKIIEQVKASQRKNGRTQQNTEKRRDYKQLKRKTDSSFHVRERLSSLVRYGLCNRGKQKGGSAWKALGYSPNDLALHLERQFLRGMGWHNRSEWHIDHIIPVSSFKYDSVHDEGFLQCWALANLRPIWKKDNLSKSAKIEFLI